MAPDVRDAVVDFVRTWTVKAGLTAGRLLRGIGLAPSTYHTWKERYGKANEHNGDVPRDHWLTDDERKAIVDFHHQYPLEGYRRLCFMMIDRNIVACSPATVYRVLSQAGLFGGNCFSPLATIRIPYRIGYASGAGVASFGALADFAVSRR